jgi:hypothetical protein
LSANVHFSLTRTFPADAAISERFVGNLEVISNGDMELGERLRPVNEPYRLISSTGDTQAFVVATDALASPAHLLRGL